MSRRFLLNQRTADFQVYVNGVPIPESEDLEKAEYIFPRDYAEGDAPESLARGNGKYAGWGEESLPNGERIKWRFVFYEDPIDQEELRGVAIFANGKLAQRPFLFNLVGGLGGQQGVEYLAGVVEADYLDKLSEDIISAERQRINWEHEQAGYLLEWGRSRVKALLNKWKELRGAEKLKLLEEKVSQFSERLNRLPNREQSVVKQALKKLADMEKLTTKQFQGLGEAILLTWEAGRLKDLINDIASVDTMTETALLEILLESEVLTAIHTLESVKAKVGVVEGLRERIEKRELENPLRDYIADHPWLISPHWEFFDKERQVPKFVREAAESSKLEQLNGFRGRMDLILSSSPTLLVVEFMRPDTALDADHLYRWQGYIDRIAGYFTPNTGGEFKKVVGYLVADRLDEDPGLVGRIQKMEDEGLYAMDWSEFLRRAERQWKQFYEVLLTRAPDDPRVAAIETPEKFMIPEDVVT